MGPQQSSSADTPRNPAIPSRDEEGKEHQLVVADHPHGLVSLFDDEMRRTMTPAAAIKLAVRLIQATCGPVGGAGQPGETI
jgi:hypothetical protein